MEIKKILKAKCSLATHQHEKALTIALFYAQFKILAHRL